MYCNNACGVNCDPESYMISSKDKKALLKEREAILEAKLATIRHWIETADSEQSEPEKS